MTSNFKIFHEQFEREKNMKALGMTALITAAIFLFLFLVSWTIPQPPPPPVDEGIEVNLGNSDFGIGKIPPQIPGDLSDAKETNTAPPQTSRAAAETNPEVADNKEPDAPVIHTSPKPALKKNPTAIENAETKKNIDKPIVNTPPKVVKPKAVYAGGKNPNNGGNNADSYNNIRNQGIAGGNGDQGKPNGNPNSDSYTGNGGTGKGGISIRSGLSGRRFTHLPSFTDDFNQDAKVAVDITVNSSGQVIQAMVNPRGTTTTNSNIRSIAVTKARQLKLNSSSADEQTGTIVFDFKLRG